MANLLHQGQAYSRQYKRWCSQLLYASSPSKRKDRWTLQTMANYRTESISTFPVFCFILEMAGVYANGVGGPFTMMHAINIASK